VAEDALAGRNCNDEMSFSNLRDGEVSDVVLREDSVDGHSIVNKGNRKLHIGVSLMVTIMCRESARASPTSRLQPL
jgi:hypothetical protein